MPAAAPNVKLCDGVGRLSALAQDPPAMRSCRARVRMAFSMSMLVRGSTWALHALVGRLGRRVPVGDDDAAERIGRDQRDEIDGVERGPPQIGVHGDAAAVVFLAVGLGPEQAARPEQAAFLAVPPAQALVHVALALALGGIARVVFLDGTGVAATSPEAQANDARQYYKNSDGNRRARHRWRPCPLATISQRRPGP